MLQQAGEFKLIDLQRGETNQRRSRGRRGRLPDCAN